MQSIHYNENQAKANRLYDRRRSAALAAKPAMQWDYTKIAYFALTMVGGSVVWAFIVGAIRHTVK
jgi:hypothetical protein